jgi:hypothetical protein
MVTSLVVNAREITGFLIVANVSSQSWKALVDRSFGRLQLNTPGGTLNAQHAKRKRWMLVNACTCI